MKRFLQTQLATTGTVALLALALSRTFAPAAGPTIPPPPWEEIRIAAGPTIPPPPWKEARVVG